MLYREECTWISFHFMNKQELASRVKLKIFTGCVITSELRMHLHQSSLWKQAKIDPSIEDLNEARFHDKDYIGAFLTKEEVSLQDIKEVEKKILQQLKTYCPQYPLNKIQLLIFSQVFVS